MNQAKIQELAALIAHNTTIVSDYLSKNGLPHPSFTINGPTTSQIPAEAHDIEAARVAVIEATQQLRHLMLGPMDYLTSYSHDELLSMQVISRFGIAKAFSPGKEATFEEIANTCKLPVVDVKRFIRHATIKDIFAEPRPGVVAHNAVSRLLAESPAMNDWVGASTDELWQAASQTVNAMVKYPGSQEPEQTGFALANNTHRSIYQEFERHPERARRFGSAMTLFTEGDAFDARHVVNGYPWEDIASGTVVDVGGSHGAICKAIHAKFPNIKFIIQDLHHVITSAPTLTTAQSKSIFHQVHDFLTPQPVQHADVYFFRWIFHNWSDKYSIKILQNLIPALKPGSRILVNDNIIPPPGVLPRWREKILRSMDLTMKEIQNSQERDLDEWKALFEAADPRFKFKDATQPTGSLLFLIEAIWTPSAEEFSPLSKRAKH